MHTIYLDVLLILNLYVNWLLLRGTARLTHSALRGFRCLLGAATGSLLSLTILLPTLPVWLSVLVKLIGGIIPVATAFGLHPMRYFWRNLGVFFGISLLFAGLLFAVCTMLNANLLIWSGSCIYLQFSLTTLILCTASTYFFLRLVCYLRLRTHHSSEDYDILIRVGTHTARQHAIADTGNNLTDLFSGRPVIIFGQSALATIPQVGTAPETLPHFHQIPFATVSGSDWMPVFLPDEVCIRSLSSGTHYPIDALVGYVPDQTNAIFNPHVLHLL